MSHFHAGCSAEAGIGFKSSSSSAEGSSTVSRGSTIQGGGNVNLTSTSRYCSAR